MAHLDEIIKQKQAAEAGLLKLEGVTGVDVGFKYAGGKRTDEIAIRVLVKKKKSVLEKQTVPAEINGIKTDVIEMEIFPLVKSKKLDDASLLSDATKYSTVKGGISLGPERVIGGYVYVGTLGCIVKDNVTNNPVLLSNFHVMCVDSGWHVGDHMCQPGRVDGGVPATDRIGDLARAVLSGHVDGAICSLSGRPYDCSIVDIGDVKGTAAAVLNAAVRKRGRTTLLTNGFVDSINATVNIDYGDGLGVHTLTNQIGIRPDTATSPKFSDHGDSGSVVVDANNKVVGLLFAGNTSGYTYINPISYVLSELNISLCTKTKSVTKDLKDLSKVEKKEKLEKVEVKEKIEKKEKLEKVEVKEKIETKEKFEKTYLEGKPVTDKLDKPDEGMPGPLQPGQLIPGARSIDERLNAIEQTLGTLSAFVSQSLRPDLSQGALKSEEDIAAAQEKLNKDIADSMG
jgi:hypothetical protein